MMTDQCAPFDARDLRTALGTFVTGVTVITTQDSTGKAHGLTANSFNTISLEPPLILWSQSKRAGSYQVFKDAKEFAISILAEDQIDVSARFAARHEDKFIDVAIDRSFCGFPVIADSSAWLHCSTVSQVDGGDHTIYIGEIKKIARSGRRPLVFGGGQYLLAQQHHATIPASGVPSGARQRHAVRMCAQSMRRIAEEVNITICAGVWGNGGPTIVDWESGTSSTLPSFPLGLVLPVTASATGKAFAANLPSDVTDPFVKRELTEIEQSSAETAMRWQAELQQIRSSGIATQPPTKFWNDEMLITTASVAVRDADGGAIVAMCAVMDSSLSASILEHACEKLKMAAASIERELGYASALLPTEVSA